MTRPLTRTVVSAAVAAVIAGCGLFSTPPPSSSPTPSPTPTPVGTPRFETSSYQRALQVAGRIRIGVSEDSPPFSKKDGTTYSGFEPDIARVVAKAIYGAPAEADPDRFIEWIPVVSATLVSVLTDDKADIVVSHFAVTAEHATSVDVTDPYLVTGERVLVKADSPVRSSDDLALRTVCTVRGSENERTVVATIAGVRLLSIDSWTACVEALERGQTDAVSADEAVLLPLRRPDMRFLPGYLSETKVAIGVKRERTGFVPFLNAVIARAVSDGTWADLYRRNITALSGELRSDPTK